MLGRTPNYYIIITSSLFIITISLLHIITSFLRHSYLIITSLLPQYYILIITSYFVIITLTNELLYTIKSLLR